MDVLCKKLGVYLYIIISSVCIWKYTLLSYVTNIAQVSRCERKAEIGEDEKKSQGCKHFKIRRNLNGQSYKSHLFQVKLKAQMEIFLCMTACENWRDCSVLLMTFSFGIKRLEHTAWRSDYFQRNLDTQDQLVKDREIFLSSSQGIVGMCHPISSANRSRWSL